MIRMLDMAIVFVADDGGAEVTELAIVAALIVAISIALISSIGGKVRAGFQSLDSVF